MHPCKMERNDSDKERDKKEGKDTKEREKENALDSRKEDESQR